MVRIQIWCAGVAVMVLGLTVGGCRSLFDDLPASELDRRSLTTILDQDEMARLLADPESRTPVAQLSPVERQLESRREELERLSPATDANRVPFDFDPDLTGQPQEFIGVSVQQAVLSGVRNNLSVRVARVQPAINREDVVGAQAAFDAVLFGSGNLTETDREQAVPVLNGIPLGTPFQANRANRFETGVRQPLRWGGEARLSADINRSENRAPGIEFSPDPSYTSALRLGLSQPLLRGFGEPVNTATIRLAQNAETRSSAELMRSLLDVAEAAESAYWDLLVAWRELEIRQWLVVVGESVRDQIAARAEFDVKPAERSNAQATVESRRADVIRARRAVVAASDRLKGLLNDDDLSVESEAVLQPVDRFVSEPVTFNLRTAVLTALRDRPEIREARLSIDDARINERVAENLRLPLLNLTGELAWIGLDDSAADSLETSLNDDFIEYVIGLTFEYPLGNRAADAELSRSRLLRSQSVLAYRQTVQNVVLEVKSALRDVMTNFELIQATRSFRVAQAENLRALEAELPLRGLTPQFLDFKFQRQDGLAEARRQEQQALARYEQSLAALYRAMGSGLERRQIEIEVVAPEAQRLAPLPDVEASAL